MRVRKRSEERKSEIVETTLRLADKVGPDRLSTETIAKAVKLTQGAIFRHFPTKQQLWEAVAARIAEKFQQRWLEAAKAGPDSGKRLLAIIGGQLTIIQSTPAIPAILFSRELHAENTRLRNRVRSVMEQFHRIVTQEVRRGQENGELRRDISAEDAGYLIIGVVQSLVMRWSLSGRDFDLPSEGERLLEVQLLGLRRTQ